MSSRISWLSRVALYLLTLASLCALSPSAAAEGFQADFKLKVVSSAGTTESAGRLEYLDPTNAYLAVSTPEQQLIWVQGSQLTLFYPTRQKVLRGASGSQVALPMLDSLSVGCQKAGQGDFAQATLRWRTRTPAGKLEQHWVVKDPRGKDVGTLVVLEGPEGIEAIQVLDDKDRVLRRYHMGPRQQVQEGRIPTWIVGEYLTTKGEHIRIETWQLSRIEALAGPALRKVGNKPEYPATAAVENMAW